MLYIYGLILILLLLLIMFVSLYYILNKSSITITNKIKENDSNFNLDEFKEIIKKSLINISESIMRCDYSGLMKVESKSLYEKDVTLIKQFYKNDYVNTLNIEDVKSIVLIDYKIENGFEHVYCRARINGRYIFLIPSKNKIEKISDNSITNWKYIDVMRSLKVKTKKNDAINLNKCPSCGAELEINNLGKCIYCHSYIINGMTSWVINKIDQYYWLGGNE